MLNTSITQVQVLGFLLHMLCCPGQKLKNPLKKNRVKSCFVEVVFHIRSNCT
jgi:hypothetical protein